MKHQTVGLQFDLQPPKGTGLRKGALPLAGVSLLAAALLLLLPPARESLKCLCNLVFAASEAVNAYAYEYFTVAADASPIPALGLLAAALAGLLLSALVGGSRVVPLVTVLILAGGEIWLGLTPPAAVNVLIFALLALLAALQAGDPTLEFKNALTPERLFLDKYPDLASDFRPVALGLLTRGG